MLKKAKKISTLYYYFYYYSQILIDVRTYAQLGKIWVKIASQRQDCIIAILKKYVLKQAIGKEQEKSKDLFISNKYKNIFEDLVDSLNIVYAAIPRQIDLPSNNISNFKDDLNESKIDNNLLDRS